MTRQPWYKTWHLILQEGEAKIELPSTDNFLIFPRRNWEGVRRGKGNLFEARKLVASGKHDGCSIVVYIYI